MTKKWESRWGLLLIISGLWFLLSCSTGINDSSIPSEKNISAATRAIIDPNVYSVNYQTNDWGSGFTATVTIYNKGSVPISNWILSWTFNGNQQITSYWNGNITQTGSSITVSCMSYNAVIPASGSVNFGFQASYSGSNPIPSSFTLSGSISSASSTSSSLSLSSVASSTVSSTISYISSSASSFSLLSSSSQVSSYISSSLSSTQYQTITLPFTYNGVGEYYYQTTGTINYINSWNLDILEVNGVNIKNQWVNGSSLPAKQNGYYYIHYKGSYSWSHVEITGASVSSSITSSSSSSSKSSLASSQSSSSSLISSYSSSVASLAGGKSPISGLPYQPGQSIPRPNGTPGNLTILNWAGFKAAISYTFDDGQPSQVQNYAQLQAEEVPLTFYICAGWSNSSPNFDTVWSQAVRDGHEIGNHTFHHSHADLLDSGTGGTPFPTQLQEIDSNAQYITSHLGQNGVWTMASPYGDTGWNTYASQRYFLNRGVGSGTIAPSDSTDPFNLPTYMASGGESTSTLNSQIDSTRSKGNWLIFLFHTLLPTANSWYAPVDTTSVTGSIKHAKALGDVWIDTLVKIGAYWRGQKILQAVTPVQSGSNITWSWTLPAHFPSGMYLRVNVSGGTLIQNGKVLSWDPHGFYEISLDAGSLTITP